ncbi:MAG: hypothetical protein H7210_10175 [Pyrinomonadaceae bacterium]|nr:hypothetical protein [Phycisphaerales bacterium]
MLTPTRRPLLDFEREQLQKEAARGFYDRGGAIAWYVVPSFVLAMIVGLIPIVGPASNPVQGLAWGIGTALTWCVCVRAGGWILFRRIETKEARRHLAADLAQPDVEVFDLYVTKAWRVVDFDDDAEVYVLRTIEGILVFLYAAFDIGANGLGDDEVPGRLCVQRLAGSHRVLGVTGSGEPLTLDQKGIPFADLGIQPDWHKGLVVLDPKGFKHNAKILVG